MAAIIYPFLTLAIVGLLAAVAIHISALFGATNPFDDPIRFLGPGVFVVMLPTIFVMNRLTRDFKQKDIWRAALRGCPQWMRRTMWITVGYAWVGCFALPFLYGGGMDSAANKARSISAGLLIFYLIPAAVIYSATKSEQSDDSRRCLNGHRASPLAKLCEECGAPVVTSSSESRP